MIPIIDPETTSGLRDECDDILAIDETLRGPDDLVPVGVQKRLLATRGIEVAT
jgi:hypothetical protein